jgi:transcription antitermination factor NusG
MGQPQKLNYADFELSGREQAWLDQVNAGLAISMVDGVYSIKKPTQKAWYVVYTNPRCEGRAEKGFLEKGFGSYVPKSVEWRKPVKRGRKKLALDRRLVRPLLTRYVFIELPVSERGDVPFGLVRAIDGVQEFVGTCDGPIVLPPAVVTSIRKREARGEFDRTVKGKKGVIAPKWAAIGGVVRVADGPFASFCGMIKELFPHDEVEVEINIFGRMIPVKFGLDQVEKVR